MKKISLAAAAPLIVVLLASCGEAELADAFGDYQPGDYSSGDYRPGGVPAALPDAPPPPPAPAADQIIVSHVRDGDTFETANGRVIRVLGIDSCEASTDAGPQATTDAAAMLMSGIVTLTGEPGVSTDQYGRELRYVQVDGADFGRAMVVKDHTAVYDGRNDANPAYVAELRAADLNGRTCDQPDPPPPPRVYAPPAPDYSDSDRDTGRRTGNSGHPCLPGERDGDNDGYCGEGR